MRHIHRYAADGFAAGAQSYAKGRPDYPPVVVDWLKDDLGLSTGKVGLDLGAGTGKFVPYLRATGAAVIAVEPVAEMLNQLIASNPDLDARRGYAEEIPLSNDSVDAVVCAQSFHWFATEAALAEIRRVLKPRGMLGLIWNVRDESVAWVAELTAIMAPYEGDVPRYHTQEWRRVFPDPGFEPLIERSFRHDHVGAPDDVIINRILSVSFIAALSLQDRQRVRRQIESLINSTPGLANKSHVAFPYTTRTYHCQKRV